MPFRAICWGGRCPGGGTGVVFNFFVSTFKGCSSSSSSESCKPYLEKCATCATRRTDVSQLRNKSSGTYFQKAPTMSWCNCQLYRGITACLQSSCGSWNKSSLCTEHLLYASLQGIAERGRFPSGQPTPVPCHPPSKVLPPRASSYSEEFLPAWLGKQKHYLKHPRSGLWTVFLESSALLPRYRLESTLVIHLCKSFRAFYQATRCFICRPDSI